MGKGMIRLVECVAFQWMVAGTGWSAQSTLAYPGTDGRLLYTADASGNKLPDFSSCGYRGGGVAIPDAPVRVTLSPTATGDDKARIQTAVTSVGAMTPDANGLRGAVLLNAGVYRIGSALTLPSGVVLRGAGQDAVGGTSLIATGAGNMIIIGAAGSHIASRNTASRQTLLDSYIPVGAKQLRIANPAAFQPGDLVLIERPSTANWIHDIGMDNISQRPGDPTSTQQWYAGKVDLSFERKVLSVDATTITIDAPVVMAMETAYGGGTVVKFTPSVRVKEVGVEKLRLMAQYEVGKEDTAASKIGNGVVINLAENCWVRQVTGRYFAGGTVSTDDPAIRITVEDCANLDPVSVITGGQRYSFPINGQRVLVQRCFSRKGRHDFITGYQNPGPNAYVDCISKNTYADSGPHNCWSTGVLYDNIQTDQLLVQDRDYLGTGQGWAGANHLLWNCEAKIICQKPPTADNWALGCKGTAGKPVVVRPSGIFESWGTAITPRSFYMTQLQDRLGAAAVNNVTTAAQRAGSISAALVTRYDEITPPVEWPWLGSLTNRSINQDTSTGAIAFIVGDAQTAAASLVAAGTSSQTSIVPNANIVFGGSGANRTVTITPVPGQTGTVVITLSISDGALVARRTFNLEVLSTAVGLPGTIYGLSNDANARDDLTVENPAATTTLMGASGSDPWVDRCTVSVFRLPEFGAVNNPFISASFTFNYVSKSGTLKNNDLYGLGRRASPEVLGADYHGRTTAVDTTNATALQPAILVDATATGPLTTSSTGSTNLRNYLNAQYAGGAGAGQYVFLRINTAAAPTGVSRATLTMSEGGVAGPPDTRPQIHFVLTDAPPTISAIDDQMIDEDAATRPIAFTVGDQETAAAELVVTALSDNQVLVPDIKIVIGGNGADRTVTITPALNQSGVANITLTVSDGLHDVVQGFSLTVDPDEDGDGHAGGREISWDRNPESATDLGFEFNTAGDFDGWAGFTRVTSPTVVGGVLTGTSSAADPFFSRHGFSFPGSSVANLIVKMKVSTVDSLQVYWGRVDSTGFGNPKVVSLAVSRTNTWQAVIAPLAGNGEWAGRTITSLRLDPGTLASQSFEIDWIRASDGDLDGDGISDLIEGRSDTDGDGLMDLEDLDSDGDGVPDMLDGPTVSPVPDLTVPHGAVIPAIAFTLSAGHTLPSAHTVGGVSSNPGLLPAHNIAFGGSGGNRTVTLLPVASQLGAATVTLNASDGIAGSSRTFVLAITGTPMETWRFTHFGTTAETIASASAADPNGDGENNLMEFATGQNPSANTRLITSLANAGSALEFTYRRSLVAHAGGVSYSVQWSDELGNWGSSGVTEEILSTEGDIQTMKASLPHGLVGRFVRLKVTQP